MFFENGESFDSLQVFTPLFLDLFRPIVAKLLEKFEEVVDVEIISFEDFAGRNRWEWNLKVVGQEMKEHLNFAGWVKSLILCDFDYFDI